MRTCAQCNSEISGSPIKLLWDFPAQKRVDGSMSKQKFITFEYCSDRCVHFANEQNDEFFKYPAPVQV